MPNDAEALVARGHAALEAGHWQDARDTFEAALEQAEIAEALYGLGEALWWLGDMPGTITYLERAYAAFRHRPDPAFAAGAALRVGFHCLVHLGNEAVAAGWFGRAARLIDEHGIDVLRGELLLMQACAAEDRAEAERHARAALELGRQMGDLDLELCSLSWLGVSLIAQGRVEEGMPLLDEAMAGSLGGEPGRLDTVVFTSCNMMTSCAQCAAFERAVQWIRAAERFAEQYGCPFLYVECRTVYGAILLATGEWTAAEAELRTAIEMSRDAVPTYFVQATAALAELRLAQGRLEEAERLVKGLEGHPATVPVTARIHLLRNDPVLAAATLKRRLDAVGDSRLESALLLDLLGAAEIAQGDHASAAERGRTLAGLGRTLGCQVILARGERLRGHALAGTEPMEARPHLDAALTEFLRLNMPFEEARTRLLLAQALRDAERETAEAEARAALARFEELGAAHDADAAAAMLRELGVQAARAGPKGLQPLTRREGEVLALLGEGLSNPEIAKRLFISRKTVEHHVSRVLAKLDLRSRAEAAAEAVRRLGPRPATS
jgi:DNA-binding CsgD family transcriptional regulator